MKNTVIFDVDGTLLNTEKIYMQAWYEAGLTYGYTIPDEALLKTRAVNKTTAITCFKQYCGEDFPFEKIRQERVRISEEIIMRSDSASLQMPYTQQTLEHLVDCGYVLATASSTDYATSCLHLEHGGLLKFFQAVVGGDMVQRGKPNPDIFFKAAQLCNATPENCVVVGDTPADVFGGTAAGMHIILIPDRVPANAQTTQLSQRVLTTLQELPAALEALQLQN